MNFYIKMLKLIDSISIDILFKLFILTSLTFLISFMLIDFFVIQLDIRAMKFIYFSDSKTYFEHMIFNTFGSIHLLLILLMFYNQKKELLNFLNENKFISFFIIFFVSYYLFFNAHFHSMFLFGTVCTLFFYAFLPWSIKNHMLKNDFTNIKHLLIYTSFLYLTVPLLVFLTHYGITSEKYFQWAYFPQLYIVDSFRGFSQDRIQYSFLSGFTILLILFWGKNIRYSNFYIAILTIGILLAISRASIFALFITIFTYAFLSKKINLKIIIPILTFLLLFIIVSQVSERTDIFSDGGNRLELLRQSLNKITENGWYSFLLGESSFYTTYINGLYPHNMILQSIMDFGVIITLLWLVILLIFFKNLNLKAKTLFIYVFIFSQFHPGFSAFLFLPVTLFSYSCILLMNQEREYQ